MVLSNTQRIETVEVTVAEVNQRVVGLESTIQQVLTDGRATVDSSARVEGRLERFREEQQNQLSLMKKNQEKFQAEIKALLANLNTGNMNRENMAQSENRGNRHNRHHHDDGDPYVDGGGGGGRWKYRKLDMPLFEGTDPDGWILRGEKYFTFYHLLESEKLDAAVVSMEGDALRWFTFESRRNPIHS